MKKHKRIWKKKKRSGKTFYKKERRGKMPRLVEEISSKESFFHRIRIRFRIRRSKEVIR